MLCCYENIFMKTESPLTNIYHKPNLFIGIESMNIIAFLYY